MVDFERFGPDFDLSMRKSSKNFNFTTCAHAWIKIRFDLFQIHEGGNQPLPVGSPLCKRNADIKYVCIIDFAMSS